MATGRRVTKAEAETVLRGIRRRFAAYLGDGADAPVLRRRWDWANAEWTIIWEGGPPDWTYLALDGGVDEEMSTLAMTMPEYGDYVRTGRIDRPARVDAVEMPPGVYAEPYSSWALCLYRTGQPGDDFGARTGR